MLENLKENKIFEQIKESKYLKQIQEKKWTVAGGTFAVVALYFAGSFLGTETIVDSATQTTVAADSVAAVKDDLFVSEDESMLVEDADVLFDSEAEIESTEFASEAVMLVKPAMEVIPATGPEEEENRRKTEFEEERRIVELRKVCEDHLRRGQWQRALEGLVELVNLRPYNADYHLTLGLVHRRLHESEVGQGHLEEATAKFREYMDYGGQEAIAFLLLAECTAVTGDEDSTFVNLEEAASRGMNIARAVQQFPALAPYTSDTRFVRSSLKLERYLLEDNIRRDPFTAPWRGAEFTNPVGEFSFLEVNEQRELLVQAREAISRIEYSIREGEYETAADSYKAIMSISSESKRFDQPELVAELKAIGDRLEELEDGVTEIRVRHLYEESRDRLDRMKRAFGDQDFEMVNRLHSEVQRFALEIEEVGEPYLTTSTLVSMAASQLRERSEVVRDFLSKTIEIDGVAISEEGSHAIVDGEWVALGGEIQGAVLQEVHRDRLVFLFQGEVIERRFGRF
ncbi:MAG: hypothetical protein CBC13_10240 [Planctomycetia bacterium TMED53]|nr:MAG: hypothetical protein CBC13_10240 [Planctomycetia bacterium TMED53]